MNRVKGKFLALVLTGSVVLAPRLVRAAAFVIDDSSTEGSIIIHLNDFEGGFSVNGNLVQQGLSNPVTVTVAEAAGPVSFSGSWIDLGQSTPSNQTIYFVEATNPTQVSDILQFSVTPGGTITGTFQSDTAGSLGTLPAGVQGVVENGQPFNFNQAFLSASAQSDLDPVPEPATLTLLATGLAAGWAGRRKNRKNRAA